MISKISRYANAPIALLNTTRGAVVTIVPGVPSPRIFDFTFIRTGIGDRLDAMAAHLYGDERLWWKIADANPEILDWTDVPVGTVLRVPSGG